MIHQCSFKRQIKKQYFLLIEIIVKEMHKTIAYAPLQII